MTAAKKAAPSAARKSSAPRKSAPGGRTTATTKKNAPKPAAKATARRAAPARGTPAAKRGATAKKAPARKATPAPKRAVAVKKAAPAPKKAVAVKKAAPAVKKAVAVKKAPVKKAPVAPKRPTVGPYAKEPKFLEEQRQLLLEERSIYKGQAVDLRAEADSLALEREPGDVQFDEESGEGGTVTVDRERNLALSAQASAAVEEIDDAMRKIERKMYGGCERCYQAIPKARLRALPFARLCVACKSGGLSRR
ncbi:MAG TPA: TraR/DksA family transcriptional regulator [Acidimicrobiales bacterium]